jgi:phenylalanyl-tRNA synthetase beta chain
MRVPLNWLAEHCAPAGLVDDPRALAVELTMTGTEVERVDHAGAPASDDFVVGKVLSADKHPDADRLKVCSVDVGEGEARTIVCGAPNVAPGQTVAVALPGAVMPGGQKLGKAKLRGVESSGMILSESEMEIGDDQSGIAVLETEASPGTPLQEVAAISDPVLELEITPNRPDCLSVYGVAREVHAITGADLGPAPWETDAEATGEGDISDHASITVEVPELCPRFTGRVFTDVKIGPSPLWLKQRLAAAGQRPLNNVVDITNYVMLLTGQPLHAFDLDKVPGGEIIVRNATQGEKMTTLDDVERTLDADAVLVCDREQPSGIAGIMGGQVSEVSETTTRVLLEAANWNGPNILSTSGKLGLRSEASTRFEKGIHPDLVMRGQIVASKLLVELCGATLVPGTLDVDARLQRMEPFTVELRMERARELLGMEITADEGAEYLRRLGYRVEADGEVLAAAVPPDRHFDTTRQVDLIEEIARVHGIDDHLPATLPSRPPGFGGLAPHQRLLRLAEDTLRDAGLSEEISWSFVAPGAAERLGGDPEPGVVVHNPLSEDGSVMRTSLIGGLIDAAAYNLARGAGRVALFESGRAYLPEPAPDEGGVLDGRFAGNRPAPAREPHRLAAIACGALVPPSWRDEGAPADFFAGKGLVELLCAALGTDFEVRPVELPFLQPGRAAEVILAGRPAGWVGELHPRLAAERDLPQPTVAFEIDAGPLVEGSIRGHEAYTDLTSHPAVLEDLAVVVDAATPAASLVDAAVEAGGELLASARVFDVYEGEQVGAGKRSVALRLEFRAPDRTLTDEEVGAPRTAIIEALGAVGGELRG